MLRGLAREHSEHNHTHTVILITLHSQLRVRCDIQIERGTYNIYDASIYIYGLQIIDIM